MEKNCVSIDELKFKKASKKLTTLLNENRDKENDFKLNQIQEILSQSLGYRNLFELKKVVFNNDWDENKKINKTEKNLLNSLTLYELNNLIVDLINLKEKNMWSNRILSLVKAVITVLVYLRDNENLYLDTNVIREYSSLVRLTKVLRERKDLPIDIINIVKNYVHNIPSFNAMAVLQNDVVIEQHGYCMSFFNSGLDYLEIIEKKDLIIGKKIWFNDRNIKKQGIDFIGKNRIDLKAEVENLEFIKYSWLSISIYETLIYDMFIIKDLEMLKISDLIKIMLKILVPEKREELKNLLCIILKNYELIDLQIQEIDKSIK